MFGFHFRRSLFVATVSIFGWSSASAEVGLIDAAKRGDEAAVSALLKSGADARAQENDGQTALHWAAYYESLPMAEQLIRAGASVNATNVYGVTPLFLACENGSSAVVERLLAAGANPAAAPRIRLQPR